MERHAVTAGMNALRCSKCGKKRKEHDVTGTVFVSVTLEELAWIRTWGGRVRKGRCTRGHEVEVELTG